MKKLLLAVTIISLTQIACTSHQKKIIVYASNDIRVDNSQKNIKVTEGSTHNEKELDFAGSEPVQLSIESPAGNFKADAGEDGLYILNLKNDTVVGSLQHVGAQSTNRITHEEMEQQADSIAKLLTGQNVSAANKNYFVPPGKMVKVTSVTGAKIFGPFTKIPASFDAGSVPELYKFYTNKEEREILSKLPSMHKE